MIDVKLIKQRLRKSREKMGYIRRLVAEKTGFGYVTVLEWETHPTRLPNAEKLAVLCQLYGVSSDYILGFTDDPTMKNNK